MKTIALIGTFDTKGEEYLYVKNKIENLGLRTLTIHAGIYKEAFHQILIMIRLLFWEEEALPNCRRKKTGDMPWK